MARHARLVRTCSNSSPEDCLATLDYSALAPRASARTDLRTWIAQLQGAIVLTIGCIVMYGWFAESAPLVRLHAGWNSMKFNTALALAALGVSVLCLAWDARRGARAAAVFAIVIGAATVGEYIFDVDLGVDRLLMEPFLQEPGVAPGRMSPVTAVLFILSGGAVILLTLSPTPLRASAAGVLASLIAGIALSALMGYATRTPTAYGWGAVASVAAHTAASFLLLAGAIAACAAGRERSRVPRWLPWAAFIAGLACTLTLGAALYAEQDASTSVHSLTPLLTMAVGALFSLTIAIALRARGQLEEQRDLLAAALQRVERELTERARLAAVVESSSEAILTIDPDLKIVTCNRAAEQLYGYAQAELQGRSIRTLIPEDRQAELEERILSSLRNNRPVHRLRTRRAHKSGALIDVELDVSLLTSPTGAALGAVSIARDITESIASEQTVSGVLEAAPDAMVICDADGRIVLVNHAAEAMFGYERAELLGLQIDQLVPQPLRGGHGRLRAQFIKAARGASMNRGRELSALRRDGSMLPVDVALNTLHLPRQTLVIAALRDVTALRESDRRVRESLEEKELLLKEIHHRVKNNLQVVASMLALQAEQARDQDARTMLAQCRERVMSMALVHQKLYGAADVRRIDLAELVRDIATMLTSGAGSIQVRFALESVIADIETAFPLSLVVNELITNALRHAFRGRNHGAIDVRVRRSGAEQALVEIADDGVGGVTSETFAKGGGLGSIIVRRLVRQLDGELIVGPGPGAAIAVQFPIPQRRA